MMKAEKRAEQCPAGEGVMIRGQTLPAKRVTLVCDVCSRERSLQRSRLRNHRGRFCSRQCAGKGKSEHGRVQIVCANCGKTFTRAKVAAELYNTHFCSRPCAATHNAAPVEYDGMVWLPQAEAARRFGVTREWVRSLAKRGRIRTLTVPRLGVAHIAPLVSEADLRARYCSIEQVKP